MDLSQCIYLFSGVGGDFSPRRAGAVVVNPVKKLLEVLIDPDCPNAQRPSRQGFQRFEGSVSDSLINDALTGTLEIGDLGSSVTADVPSSDGDECKSD